ncbi:MAG: hypothetical protein R3360_02875, partial [Alphaproteobacteria bacterium]|nr:hypothetical protein [Alphaproteobacteria bacterium]
MTQPMTRLSTLLFGALMLAGLMVSVPAQAQDSAPTVRALIVDLQEIQRTSLAGKDLLRQMETHRAELESEVNRFEQQVERERADLQNKRAQVEQGVRTEDAFQENLRASQSRVAEERAKLDDKRRRLQIAASRADRELGNALTPI